MYKTLHDVTDRSRLIRIFCNLTKEWFAVFLKHKIKLTSFKLLLTH